jgi:hypothetical protein
MPYCFFVLHKKANLAAHLRRQNSPEQGFVFYKVKNAVSTLQLPVSEAKVKGRSTDFAG